VAALPLARASDGLLPVGIRVAVIALVALVAILVNGWPRLLPVPILAIGGLYAAQLLVDERSLDGAVPLVAAGLYATAELAYWSLEERERVKPEPGEKLRRLALVALLGLGALVSTAALLVLVDSVGARGLTLDLVGAVGAAGVLVAIVLLARAPGRSRG
jgi:hypothetical protein